MNLSQSDITAILLKIAKQYPHSNTDTFLQIKGFAKIFNIRDLAIENAQMLYGNFTKGEFWARDWMAAGADENTLQREFPCLFALNNGGNLAIGDRYAQSGATSIQIGVAELDDCIESKNCSRSLDEIKLALRVKLVTVIDELFKQNLYQLSTGELVYMSENEFNAYRVINPSVTGVLEKPYAVSVHYVGEKTPTIHFYSPSDKIYTASVYLQFNLCAEKAVFNYSYKDPQLLPVLAKCSMC
jgi:hypothetical protein